MFVGAGGHLQMRVSFAAHPDTQNPDIEHLETAAVRNALLRHTVRLAHDMP